ncbi:hypothetical protein COOONC_01925 [Cooperia oncophora]
MLIIYDTQLECNTSLQMVYKLNISDQHFQLTVGPTGLALQRVLEGTSRTICGGKVYQHLYGTQLENRASMCTAIGLRTVMFIY